MDFVARFKSLPAKTKRLLGLGVVMALFVGLPLFVWAVVTQKFLISQKAQEAQDIGQKIVKVLVLEYNPLVTGGQKLSVSRGWNNPLDLETQYVQKLKEVSGDYADYQIAERVTIDDFPELSDGYKYTEEPYLNCLSDNQSCHAPTMADYLKILNSNQVCEKVNSGEIDELWLWGGPWFGYWEANMAGPNAFITNGPVVPDSTCNRKLNIMGFNYERGLPEMIEDFGHRFEGTMNYTFSSKGLSLWTDFIKNEKTNPGQAACGTIHIPPNGASDYDWANPVQVSSSCEDYLNYPDLTLTSSTFGCEKWGCTDLAWKTYWLSHIPKVASYTSDTWDNWWRYVLDYDNAISSTPSPSASPTESPTASPTESPTASPTTTPTQTPTPTPAPEGEPNACGGTCGSNYNCKADFYCYQGFCRNPFCPSDINCDCITQTNTPSPTPIRRIFTPEPSPTSNTTKGSSIPGTLVIKLQSPTPSPSGTPIAQIEQKPNLNFLLWIAGGSFSAAVVLFLLAL
jgi:hypothetical protein